MNVIKKFEPLFGDWYAESFIGAGSFGRVYKIYREELGHRFCSALKYISIPSEEGELKQLRLDGMDDESISTYYDNLAQNIHSEIDLMNRLKGNTNVISFEDSRIIPKPDGVGYDIFIRMELLESLTNHVVSNSLSVEEAVKLGMDVCNALTLCAKNQIIHRDVKPDNIFISPNGDYKLGDFGVARQLEKTASFMSKKGTYTYMAPEVYKGEEYGATCDIYSLGLVMYRLLNNGRLPFLPPAPAPISPEDRELAIIRRMKGEAFAAPCAADPELSRIVLKACAFDIQQRYDSAEKMYQDLFLYNVHRQQTARTAQSKADTSFSNRIGTLEESPEPVRTAPEREPQEPGAQKSTLQLSRATGWDSEPQEKPHSEEPGPQKSTLQLTRAAGWDSEPQETPRSEKPALQKEDASQAVKGQPKPQMEEVPMNTGSSSDEVAELKRLIGYFSQKSKQYKEYDGLAVRLAQKPKNNRLFLILGIAGTALGLVLMSIYISNDIMDTVRIVLGIFLLFPCLGFLLYYFFRRSMSNKAYREKVRRFDEAAAELYAYYKACGPCFVAPEYTNPATLRAILSAVLSGTANNTHAAIAQMRVQAAEKNPAAVAAYDAVIAANAARKARVPVVFYPEGMFESR